jgi:hypothetical protein
MRHRSIAVIASMLALSPLTQASAVVMTAGFIAAASAPAEARFGSGRTDRLQARLTARQLRLEGRITRDNLRQDAKALRQETRDAAKNGNGFVPPPPGSGGSSVLY